MVLAWSSESYDILTHQEVICSRLYTQIFSLNFWQENTLFSLGFLKTWNSHLSLLADHTFQLCNFHLKLRLEITYFQKENAHLNRKCTDLQTCLLWEFLCHACRSEKLSCFLWGLSRKIIVQLKNISPNSILQNNYFHRQLWYNYLNIFITVSNLGKHFL